MGHVVFCGGALFLATRHALGGNVNNETFGLPRDHISSTFRNLPKCVQFPYFRLSSSMCALKTFQIK